MDKHFMSLLVAAVFVLYGCSTGNNAEAISDNHDSLSVGHLMPDTAEALQPESGPLPVINRSHYHTIEIKQMKFFPEELTVARGDTVVWVNNGITAHDVTEQPGNRWTSSSMPQGTSWQMVAEETADYYCSIHVVMKGKLIVK